MFCHSQDKDKADTIRHDTARRLASAAHAALLVKGRNDYDRAYLENVYDISYVRIISRALLPLGQINELYERGLHQKLMSLKQDIQTLFYLSSLLTLICCRDWLQVKAESRCPWSVHLQWREDLGQ